MTLHYSIMVLLHSTLLYINLPWLYFILLYSTLIYHGALIDMVDSRTAGFSSKVPSNRSSIWGNSVIPGTLL